MWVLIASFVLISRTGLAGISKMVGYSKSFPLYGGGRHRGGRRHCDRQRLPQTDPWQSFRKIRPGEHDNLCLFPLWIVATVDDLCGGVRVREMMFVCAAIAAIFFWASLFSLFPIAIGHYYGETAAGGNYGVLYAIAKGSGGFYGASCRRC